MAILSRPEEPTQGQPGVRLVPAPQGTPAQGRLPSARLSLQPPLYTGETEAQSRPEWPSGAPCPVLPTQPALAALWGGERGLGGGWAGCPSPTSFQLLIQQTGNWSASHPGLLRVPSPTLGPTDQLPWLCDLERAPYPPLSLSPVRVGAAACHFSGRKSLSKKEVLDCCQPSANFSVALSRGHDPSRRREDRGATKSPSSFNRGEVHMT